MLPEKSFRRINEALGKQPKIGPFPAGQIIPFFIIVLLSWVIKEVFHLSWLNTFLVAVWFMGTAWILTGRQSWRFFSKFIATPYWVRTLVHYDLHIFKVEIKAESRRKKVPNEEVNEKTVLLPPVPRPPQPIKRHK